ncbi:hypothetical protein [uncultured Campylobacter sp.]|uniref:hypothetical protein n=1 Tax=uncultured Campylobacter sp. TaxID=218934 RepID=UPI002605653C|nr:hypothetical protein [uncultured Campylobacter sp.]
MADEFLNPNVFVTPDYLEVFPLGINPDAKCDENGGSGGSSGGGGSGGSSGANNKFNPFDYLSELDQIIEDWMNKNYTFDDVNLRNKLLGIIKDIKETKSELLAVNGKIKAIVENNDVAITTDDEALAQAIKKINAKFGEISASIDQIKQAYTSADTAIAQKFEQLKASMPDAYGIATEITKNVETQIKRSVDGKVSSITGDLTQLKTKVDNQDIKITNASAIATQAKEWAARVKSVVTDGNRITGWQYADGSGRTSTFEIMADNFRISNSSRSLSPFVIVGNKIRFTGNVEFDQIQQKGTVVRIRCYRKAGISAINPHKEAGSFNPDEQYALICMEWHEDAARTKYKNGVYITDRSAAAQLVGAPAMVPFSEGVITIFYFRNT